MSDTSHDFSFADLMPDRETQDEWLRGHAFAWAVREVPYGGGSADEVANAYASWYVEQWANSFARNDPTPDHPHAFMDFQAEQIRKGNL